MESGVTHLREVEVYVTALVVLTEVARDAVPAETYAEIGRAPATHPVLGDLTYEPPEPVAPASISKVL